MELDHIFMFVEPDGPDIAYLHALGLVETYRRTHAGQGTRNICFCFDNMFLECIWATDETALRSEAIARTGLYERSQWRKTGACPFGIAWRGDGTSAAAAVWAFRPPYLPAGLSIAVSIESDDPRHPMMFRSPGGTPPSAWPADRAGALQKAAGLGRVLGGRLALARGVEAGPALRALMAVPGWTLGAAPDGMAGLTLEIERKDGAAALVVRLPVARQLGGYFGTLGVAG